MKRSRLRKLAEHDYSNRDEAITIIDGKVYTGVTHAECINEYLENQIGEQPFEYFRPEKEVLDRIYDLGSGYAFAHKVEKEKAIYLEEKYLEGITLEEATAILKEKYPDYTIYNDDVKDPTNPNRYQLVASYLMEKNGR